MQRYFPITDFIASIMRFLSKDICSYVKLDTPQEKTYECFEATYTFLLGVVS